MRQIEKFRTAEGASPFDDWINDLDVAVRAQIRAYVDRVAARGGRRNIRRLMDADGILEIRIHRGPGYRVYYREVEDSTILLLLGGDKRTQDRDIDLARKYWRQFREKTQHIR